MRVIWLVVALLALLVSGALVGCAKRAPAEGLAASAPDNALVESAPAPANDLASAAPDAPGNALTTGGPAAKSAPPAPRPRLSAAAAASGPLGTALQKAQALRSYEMTTTMPAGPTGQPVTLRTLVEMSGGQTAAIVSVSPRGVSYSQPAKRQVYMYNPQDKTAFLVPPPTAPPAGAGAAAGAGRPGGAPRGGGFGGRSAVDRLTTLAAENPKVSDAKLGSLDCWLVQTTDPRGDVVKTWIDKQYGLTRQTVVGERTLTFAYSRINQVSPSEFQLPSGTKMVSPPANFGQGRGFGQGGGRRGGPPAGGGQ
ncbi:MAG TPA: hypothetical protein VGM19_14775 [Armatimonadota bacterium]|jgi:hypothetical protein